MTAVHAHPITVQPADVDELGHVNNAVYQRWVQDAVVAHWRAVAPPDAVARHLWVALKHEIAYRRPALPTDAVLVVATLERFSGVRAFYRTVVRRGAEVLAAIESCWCCLDAARKRPAKLADDVARLFRRDEKEAT